MKIYMPIFSAGISEAEIRLVEQTFSDVEADFPGDIILLGGDFNLDRWRTAERRVLRVPIPPLVR
jgi:hypothetical protein